MEVLKVITKEKTYYIDYDFCSKYDSYIKDLNRDQTVQFILGIKKLFNFSNYATAIRFLNCFSYNTNAQISYLTGYSVANDFGPAFNYHDTQRPILRLTTGIKSRVTGFDNKIITVSDVTLIEN